MTSEQPIKASPHKDKSTSIAPEPKSGCARCGGCEKGCAQLAETQRMLDTIGRAETP
ncbi:MAG: hypothetical protein MRY74_15880 [Neomegalonema sp.]|nr:hypothetical protein [Neomegalonema sp.]